MVPEGRIFADKMDAQAGPQYAWRIAHRELLRYQRDGLLPIDSTRNL